MEQRSLAMPCFEATYKSSFPFPKIFLADPRVIFKLRHSIMFQISP